MQAVIPPVSLAAKPRLQQRCILFVLDEQDENIGKASFCSPRLRNGRSIEVLLGAGRRESMALKAAGNPGGSKKSSPGSGTTSKITGGKGGQGSSKTGKSKSGTK